VAELHVLRVFTTPSGEHGNELGVFMNGDHAPEAQRQAIAADLDFAETVFVDDLERAEMRIFTPEIELPFAGHPSVGTAWLLREKAGEVAVLRPPAGELRVRYEEEIVWVAARAEWSPPFEYIELAGAAEVDALAGAPGDEEWAYCWAWDDEEAGRVRARSFVTGGGIAEDEATGSAALALCAQLGRPIQIRQGQGSEVFARPVDEGFTEVGGRTVADEVRDYPIVDSR
jgi:predicted PhzF superfamily epimerase YddE/YHI9